MKDGERQTLKRITIPVYAVAGLFLWVVLSAFAYTVQQTDPIQQATDELEEARRQQTDFLAPRSFQRAQREYQQYIDMVRQGRPTQDTTPVLERFHAYLNTALQNASQARAILAAPLKARTDARDANAMTVVPADYERAETRLREAIGKIEDGKLAEADKIGQNAATRYRQSVMAAVRVGLVGLAQTRLAEARARRAAELAPRTYTRAQTLIQEIEAALAQNPEGTEDLQAKARLAEYEAQHALYLAARIDTLRQRDSNWEREILHQESILARIADYLGEEYRFDRPGDVLVDSILQAIQQDQNWLQEQIAKRDRQIDVLNQRVDSLKTVFNQHQIRLASMLEEYQSDLQARKEELERKRRQLEAELQVKLLLDATNAANNIFSKKEALVVREEDLLIIRLIGIDFRAGKASLPEKDLPLLDKLGEFLNRYPSTAIRIEGHTDATGSEEKNLELSEARAAAVRQYLMKNAGIPEDRIASQGLGSAHPVASNRTPQGRAQNRRIDVRLTFGR